MSESEKHPSTLDLPIIEFLARPGESRQEAPSGVVRNAEDPEQMLYDRANAILSWMQPGLIYPAPFQCALSIFGIPERLTLSDFANLLSAARRLIHTTYGD